MHYINVLHYQIGRSNGVVAMQGLQLYGIARVSPLFDEGIMRHHNRLKFAITSAYTTPSDLETEFIMDSTANYLAGS